MARLAACSMGCRPTSAGSMLSSPAMVLLSACRRATYGLQCRQAGSSIQEHGRVDKLAAVALGS